MPTSFAQMTDLVVAETRRPELGSVTTAAIKSATLRAHHTDFFPRDLVGDSTQTFSPNSSAYFYDFPNVSTLFPRCRSIQFVQMLDTVNFRPVEKLEYRNTNDNYDENGDRRPSIYNLIGDTLRILPQDPTGRIEVFYYQNPNLIELQYSSWIADTYPEELAKWAAGIVFARTGYLEQANNYQDTHVKPFKEILIASHLLGNVS